MIVSTILGAIAPVLSFLAIIAVIAIALVIIGKVLYKPAPPNKAIIVTSPWGSKTVTGKGTWVIPILQRTDELSLENIQSDFTSRSEIPTKDAINIMVDAVANVAISQDPARMKVAAARFLGYKTSQIREIITPVLEGNIREIISQITLIGIFAFELLWETHARYVYTFLPFMLLCASYGYAKIFDIFKGGEKYEK